MFLGWMSVFALHSVFHVLVSEVRIVTVVFVWLPFVLGCLSVECMRCALCLSSRVSSCIILVRMLICSRVICTSLCLCGYVGVGRSLLENPTSLVVKSVGNLLSCAGLYW